MPSNLITRTRRTGVSRLGFQMHAEHQRRLRELQAAGLVDGNGKLSFGEALRLYGKMIAAEKGGGKLTDNRGVASYMGSDLSRAAQLASSKPGLSKGEFTAEFGDTSGRTQIDQLWRQYQLLAGGSAPQNADEVTSPEPEGPGRFSATRPKDLIPSSPMRFNANG